MLHFCCQKFIEFFNLYTKGLDTTYKSFIDKKITLLEDRKIYLEALKNEILMTSDI